METDILISMILDRSGSMAGQINSVIEHFNIYKEEVSELPGARLSVYQFDTEYETIVENLPIEQVPDLTTEVYFARGSTALLDAIGRTISHIDSILDKPSKIVIVVNTDGYENASREFNREQIKQLITDRQNQDWQFVFVGAGVDAFTAGQGLGLSNHSFYSTTSNSLGYNDTYTNLSTSLRSFRRGMSNTVDLNVTDAGETK